MKRDAPHWHNLSHIYRPNNLRSHLIQSLLHSQWLGNALSVWALKAFLLCFFDSGARTLWLNYHPNLAGLEMTEGFMTNLQNRKWQFLVGLWGFSFYSHLAYLKMSGSVILEAQILYFTLCVSLASGVIICYLMTSVAVASKMGSMTDLMSWSMLLILRLTLRHKGVCVCVSVYICAWVCHSWRRKKSTTFFYWNESHWLSDVDSLGLNWLKAALSCCCFILV